MQEFSYRFEYSGNGDNIRFTVGSGLQRMSITMGADDFFNFCGNIVATGGPFLDKVQRARAEGIHKDIEFDTGAWEKLMGTGG